MESQAVRSIKRGIALTPVKFGISFTATHYNQAGRAGPRLQATVRVLLNHGGTEMGQGLFTKVRQVVAHGARRRAVDAVRVSASDTSKVPNASPTAAVVGQRHQRHGRARRRSATLRERLAAFAARAVRLRAAKPSRSQDGDGVRAARAPVVVRGAGRRRRITRACSCRRPASTRRPRSTTTATLRCPAGRSSTSPTAPRCTEVAIDTLTGEHRLCWPSDILHDVGASLNPAIDRGQIEGGFMQGWGWLAMEELWWNAKGELKTHAPSTYKDSDVARRRRQHFARRLLRRDRTARKRSTAQGGRRAAADAGACPASTRCATRSPASSTTPMHRRCRRPRHAERVLAAVDALRASATRSARCDRRRPSPRPQNARSPSVYRAVARAAGRCARAGSPGGARRRRVGAGVRAARAGQRRW